MTVHISDPSFRYTYKEDEYWSNNTAVDVGESLDEQLHIDHVSVLEEWSNITIDVSISYPVEDYYGNLTYQIYTSNTSCM